jgi:hypothetical protein
MSLQSGKNYFLASGASAASGVYTATSGSTKLYDILIYPISGGPAASSSGITLSVFDAVSGMANVNSGSLIWSYAFGSQSGFGTSAAQIPQLVGPLTLGATSGVVVQTNAGWVVNVVYGG